ncbi:MAG TPA: beta-propeller fold lactonase family protein, partial [Caldilineaceae bacterium]|nr:beta-propeller fold lactonase family protein [Caldilineaceae bacterium]
MLQPLKRLFAGLVLVVLLMPLTVQAQGSAQGAIVVANRATGTISVIDVATDQVIHTVALPGAQPPEPMYVVYVKVHKRLFVGDRANDQVAVFDAKDYSLIGTVPTGAGIFHMWADPNGKQLWVNNDSDNTATVIDPRTLDVLATVPMPAAIIAAGGKPHDVILDPKARAAFVTFVGVAGPNDRVVKFDTDTFQAVAQAAVGKDPHLSLTKHSDLLYVPAQNSNTVTVLERETLMVVTDIAVMGAHGAGMRDDGAIFYTTNLPGGGVGGLVTIDTGSNSVLGTTDTPLAVPHNIALTKKGEKLYVT